MNVKKLIDEYINDREDDIIEDIKDIMSQEIRGMVREIIGQDENVRKVMGRMVRAMFDDVLDGAIAYMRDRRVSKDVGE